MAIFPRRRSGRWRGNDIGKRSARRSGYRPRKLDGTGVRTTRPAKRSTNALRKAKRRRRETVVRSMNDLSSSTASLQVPFPCYSALFTRLFPLPRTSRQVQPRSSFLARRSAPPLPVPGFRSRSPRFPPLFVGPCCCPFFPADGSVPERRKNRRDGSSGLCSSRGCGRRSLSGSVVGFSVCRCGAACT